MRAAVPNDVPGIIVDLAVTERRDGSRHSCQLAVTEEFDGVTVEIPPDQP